MSADRVDDLHAAEDRICELESALDATAECLAGDPEMFAENMVRAMNVLVRCGFADWGDTQFRSVPSSVWCRPSCMSGEYDDIECDDDDCGCCCHG